MKRIGLYKLFKPITVVPKRSITSVKSVSDIQPIPDLILNYQLENRIGGYQQIGPLNSPYLSCSYYSPLSFISLFANSSISINYTFNSNFQGKEAAKVLLNYQLEKNFKLIKSKIGVYHFHLKLLPKTIDEIEEFSQNFKKIFESETKELTNLNKKQIYCKIDWSYIKRLTELASIKFPDQAKEIKETVEVFQKFDQKNIVPILKNPQNVGKYRGIPSEILQYYFQTRMKSIKYFNKSKYFKMSYFPQSHFLSTFCIGDIGITHTFDKSTILNDPKILDKSINKKFGKSMVVFDYEHYRKKASRLLKREIYKIQKFETIKKIKFGFYMFHLIKIPIDEESLIEYRNDLIEAFRITSFIDYEDIKKINFANNKVNWNQIDNILNNNGLSIPKNTAILKQMIMKKKP
ncbi:hypothetical protein WICMUC_005174 [Wickerhamomyces mucosus]|uniref:Uncharacterized protein n=1 Tax=Wickerhamomyces mucosus TaxID=1378264 RepID=A0A9P8T7E7_9ASCO|nr:hypothetical protein WICMUC_005174 [Wickerhamomyces mucosus]